MEKTGFLLLTTYFIKNFDVDVMLGKIGPRNPKEILALQFFTAINDIAALFDKLAKYDVYFEDFYPANFDNISAAEALEYHLHSYLQDSYLVKERVENTLNLLKNKLNKYNLINILEIEKALKHVSNQIENALDSALVLRHKHVHRSTVRDNDLSNAIMIHTILNLKGQFSTTEINEMTSKYEVFLSTAKNKYMAQAKNNKSQVLGMKDYFAIRFGYIFSSLNGHSNEEFAQLLKD